ncbi:MAG: hypothetical protein QW584_01510, partial [Thermofilaceae archaeon]
ANLGRTSDVIPPQRPIVRVKVEVPDEVKFAVVDAMSRELSERYETITIDGVKVMMEEAWVLIRASNTEPVVRVSCEAKDWSTANKLAEQFAQRVKEYASRMTSCSRDSR